jgi:hypothetical protein
MPRLPDRPLFDEEAGPLVRSYQLTNGRVPDEDDGLDLISLVTTSGIWPPHLDDVPATILRLASGPISIAELSGKLKRPAMVIKVLVSDLEKARAVTVTMPELVADDTPVLEALLHGLQRRL